MWLPSVLRFARSRVAPFPYPLAGSICIIARILFRNVASTPGSKPHMRPCRHEASHADAQRNAKSAARGQSGQLVLRRQDQEWFCRWDRVEFEMSSCAATLRAEALEIAPQSRAPVRPSSYLPGVPRRARWSAGPRAVSPKTRRTLPHARIQATGPLDIACAALLRQPCFDPLLTLPVSDK